MIVDLNDYKYLKPIVQMYLSRDLDKSDLDIIRDIAIPSNVPLVVVAHYMAQEIGMTEEIQQYIKDLTDFYQYSKIIAIGATK